MIAGIHKHMPSFGYAFPNKYNDWIPQPRSMHSLIIAKL